MQLDLSNLMRCACVYCSGAANSTLHRCLVSALLILLGAISPAIAANISSVGSAQVTRGALDVQWRQALSSDDTQRALDGQWVQRFAVDYGFSDDYALGVYLQTVREGGRDVAFESVIIDHRFQFTDEAADGYLSGMRLRYRLMDNALGADRVDIRFLASTRLQAWELRTYQIMGMDVGQGRQAGVSLDSRFQASNHVDTDWRLGVESFSNLGNLRRLSGFDRAEHYIGPMVAFGLTDDVRAELAYHVGLSAAAADHSLRLGITRRF